MSGVRTYQREHIVESRRRWDEGEFGPEWAPYRTQAAGRGFIFPPGGSRHDSVEDQPPSQRAIIHRAIEDTPRLLRDSIGRSQSWGEVVAQLLAELDRRREAAGIAERKADLERESDRGRLKAPERLSSIMARLGQLR